jgi:hypothetical protein
MVSSGMLRSVALVRTNVSEELSASFIRVTRLGELGTTLAVTSNRRKFAAKRHTILQVMWYVWWKERQWGGLQVMWYLWWKKRQWGGLQVMWYLWWKERRWGGLSSGPSISFAKNPPSASHSSSEAGTVGHLVQLVPHNPHPQR